MNFERVPRSTTLVDERGRLMTFPNRGDYLRFLVAEGAIQTVDDFMRDDVLTESVFLDWLRRGQVGCVFAQLFARQVNRAVIRTLVARGQSGVSAPEELAVQIDQALSDAVANPSSEALSVLLPQVLDPQHLTRLVTELARLPGWRIEREASWRRTLVLVALRVEIAAGVWAEPLGMGPFSFFPPTRQSPITSLDIRTKTERARRGRLNRSTLAAHLAQMSTGDMLTKAEFGVRFSQHTRKLRRRILGGQDDHRAKAGVTFALPAAIWTAMKETRR